MYVSNYQHYITTNLNIDFVTLVKKGKQTAAKTAGRPPFMEDSYKGIFQVAEFVNQEHIRRSELPSANFHSSAKSLGKIAAMMANHGEPLEENGTRLMSHETWLKMHANEKKAFDSAMSSNFSLFT
jgi:hypothetical protein